MFGAKCFINTRSSYTVHATADAFRIPYCTGVFKFWANKGFVGSVFDCS